MGGGGGVSCGTYNFVWWCSLKLLGLGMDNFVECICVFGAPAQPGNMYANDQEKEGRQ